MLHIELVADRCPLGARLYGMKKHHASRLHYDLRLEWDGGLLSWALPKGPSRQATVIRQAIEMESHRKAYLGFEGEHETGTIMLWIVVRGNHIQHPPTSEKIYTKEFCDLRCTEKS